MKDSKDKEHRISNLKDMINTAKGEDVQQTLDTFSDEDIEEDAELIDYLKEDTVDFDDYEIDDEFIYHPGDEGEYAINLEDNAIDENFIIKTDLLEENSEDYDEIPDTEEDILDFDEDFDNIDNVFGAKIGKTPVLAIISAILGIALIVLSVFVFNSRSDRIIDHVVSGETNFIVVVFLIFGLLLLIYGIYNIFSIKNPFENISNSINSIDKATPKKDQKSLNQVDEDSYVIPKSTIPLDKDSYKIGEFDMDELKDQLKKPTSSKKSEQANLDEIPPAKEKSDDKKGLTDEEIQEMEHDQAILDNESIDDIFAGVEDIDVDQESKK